ncbi:hypothetical protein [Streptomyces sp. NPDC047985]|uniref:hypothetical protein n=1 Tax=unclassified Streptomyces TaxID=2593676 RepID=UPI00341EC75D
MTQGPARGALRGPAHSENVNCFGTVTIEVDTERAELDRAGYRPLRPRRPDRT